MVSKKTTSTTPVPRASPADSKGNRRVYVDLPAPLITKMNVLAATHGLTKRAMITMLLTEAIRSAKES